MMRSKTLTGTLSPYRHTKRLGRRIRSLASSKGAVARRQMSRGLKRKYKKLNYDKLKLTRKMYGDSRILGRERDYIARRFGANSKKQRERLIEQSEKRKDKLLNKRCCTTQTSS